MIAYTSGTTGKPKGSVHVHGGFLVKIASEVAYQTDYQPGELLFWFTDPGWIMGPWEIVGTLALGGTIFLYDGAPDHPGPRSAVGHGRAAPHQHPRRVADARSRARAARRRARDEARPVIAAHPRIDGGAVEHRAVPLVLREGRRRTLSDHQLLRRNGGRRVLPVAVVATPLKACSLGGPALGMAVDVFDDERQAVARRRSVSSCAPNRGRG